MTSSQESKEPPTLHFNFQQKTFTTLNYYRCWLLKKPSQPLCLLLIVVMASFYGGGACSRLILSEKGEVHFWGNKGTIKRANNSDKLIRKIDETYFPTFSSCCPHNFFAESLLSCQSNHRQTGSKKNWFSFNFFSTKESAMQIYAKNSIWNIQKIVLR